MPWWLTSFATGYPQMLPPTFLIFSSLYIQPECQYIKRYDGEAIMVGSAPHTWRVSSGRGVKPVKEEKPRPRACRGVGVMMGCRPIPPRPISTDEQGRDRGLPACGGGGGELTHGLGLRALGGRDDLKLDPIAFVQGTKAPACH